MKTPWSQLARMTRRISNLTQEDFAADLGRSQSLVAQWESGQRTIPYDARRKMIDILTGYYKYHPQIEPIILSDLSNSNETIAIHAPMHIGVWGSKKFLDCWKNFKMTDFVGARIIEHIPSNHQVNKIIDLYTTKMLEGKSEVVSLTSTDSSVLFTDKIVRREITAIDVGNSRALIFREQVDPIDETIRQQYGTITLITKDGTVEVVKNE